MSDGSFDAEKIDEELAEIFEERASTACSAPSSAASACAERNGGRVLTLDRRHFGGPGLGLEVLPARVGASA